MPETSEDPISYIKANNWRGGGYLVPEYFRDTLLMIAYGIDPSELPPLISAEADAINVMAARHNPIWRWLYRKTGAGSRLAWFIVSKFPRVPNVAMMRRWRDNALERQYLVRRQALHEMVEAKRETAECGRA